MVIFITIFFYRTGNISKKIPACVGWFLETRSVGDLLGRMARSTRVRTRCSFKMVSRYSVFVDTCTCFYENFCLRRDSNSFRPDIIAHSLMAALLIRIFRLSKLVSRSSLSTHRLLGLARNKHKLPGNTFVNFVEEAYKILSAVIFCVGQSNSRQTRFI